MQEFEKIFEEIENHAVEFELFGISDDYISVGWVKDIIRKHMNDDKHGECSRREWYQKGYEDGKKSNDGWIPVEEALPEQSGEYLTTSALGACAVLNFSAKYGLFNAFDDSDKKSAEKYAIRKVVAWQPLPQPYKPGRSET